MSTITLTIDLNQTSEAAVTEALRILRGGNAPAPVAAAPAAPAKTEKPKAAKEAAAAEVQKAAKEIETSLNAAIESVTKTAEPVTIEQVRAAVSEKVKAGHKEAVKKILEDAGAASVSTLDAKHYTEVFNQINAL